MTKVTFPVVLSSTLSSSRGIQRTVKSKWLFHVFLSLLIVLCSMSTQALVDSPVGSPAQRDKGSSGDTSRASSSFGNTNQMVWNYLVTKYAGSARRGLTAEDLEGMAKSMQKCDSFQVRISILVLHFSDLLFEVVFNNTSFFHHSSFNCNSGCQFHWERCLFIRQETQHRFSFCPSVKLQKYTEWYYHVVHKSENWCAQLQSVELWENLSPAFVLHWQRRLLWYITSAFISGR